MAMHTGNVSWARGSALGPRPESGGMEPFAFCEPGRWGLIAGTRVYLRLTDGSVVEGVWGGRDADFLVIKPDGSEPKAFNCRVVERISIATT